MRKTTMIPAVIAILTAILACNLPSTTPSQQNPDAILTAAALTVQAQLAANSPATATSTEISTTIPGNTPTFTSIPLPTLTSSPIATATTQCDFGKFVKDITVPDGTVYAPNSAFTKTWRLQNIGSCTWSGYSLVFDSGNSMGGVSISAINTTPPGAYVDLSVNLTAPATAGSYRGYWRIRNAASALIPIQGGYNSQSFYVDIQVSGGVAFAVTHVTYTLSSWSDAGHTNCPRVIAHITTNGAGTVTYHWIRSDNGSTSTFTLTYGSAGTQSTNYDWALPHVWNGTTEWVGIYNDSPNNQNFGHLTFTTACTFP